MADTAEFLRNQANRCRQLASSTLDERISKTLRHMADEYEQKAQDLRRKEQD
jgi:hypothetical protein